MSALDSSAFTDISKRRRACDLCRRSKVRCNPPASQDIPCAHCAQLNLQCTFQEDSKKRAPPKSYIVSLENRCKQLESLVKRIAPDLDLEAEIGPPFTQDTWTDRTAASLTRSSSVTSSTTLTAASTAYAAARSSERAKGSSEFLSGVDPDITVRIKEELEGLDLGKTIGTHFLGTSSAMELLRTAFHLKDGGNGKPQGTPEMSTQSRVNYWSPPAWRNGLNSKPPIVSITWPADDLQEELINLYFENAALLLPIVHRVSFLRHFRGNLHRTDFDFARLALLVFSLGCRFSDDPRICLPGHDGKVDPTSAGWVYFIQIQPLSQELLEPCGLSYLQALALAALFLQYVGGSHPAWLISGIGVRIALDLGLHAERAYSSDHPLKSQAWRRTFWALVSFDIIISARLGRPCAVALDEVDADLPLEVDYEHYDELTRQWKQPAGQPAKASSFVQFIKLQKIVARAVRTICEGQVPNPHFVSELDDMLSSWHNDLPQHLRWDPNAENPIFLQQAAVLRLFFLSSQLTVYRRFLPIMLPGSPPSALSTSAVAICTTAAQATVRVIQGLRHAGYWTFPFSGFTMGAATILLLNIRDMERKDPSHIAISRWMEDVDRCIDILRVSEQRWQIGPNLLEILKELAPMRGTIIGSVPSAPPQKRTREPTDSTDGGSRYASRAFRHYPLSGTGEASTSAPVQLSAHQSSTPFYSQLLGDVPESTASLWDPSFMEGLTSGVGHYPATAFDIPQGSESFEGTSGLEGYLRDFALPGNLFPTLMGGLDDVYGTITQLDGMVDGGAYGINDWGAGQTHRSSGDGHADGPEQS